MNSKTVPLVEVVRGGVVESRHFGSAAVVDADGVLIASAGDPQALTFLRSAAKPFQALPLVEEGVVDAFRLTPAELALCCASHEGEAAHVDGARSILRKSGSDESLLRCGAHAPYSSAAALKLAASGQPPEPIHNNCSGKHAGMLALAQHMGWDPHDYHLLEHPVQQRMFDEVCRWTGLRRSEVRVGVDGCGVSCFAAPLDRMARAFARFGDRAEHGGSPHAVIDAMTGEPFMVGGTGRACTDVMAAGRGSVFVKLGAEGVYGGGIPSKGLGFAIKVADGGRRAVEVALVRLLECLDVFSATQLQAVKGHGSPVLRNTRGEEVGELRSIFDVSVPLRVGG